MNGKTKERKAELRRTTYGTIRRLRNLILINKTILTRSELDAVINYSATYSIRIQPKKELKADVLENLYAHGVIYFSKGKYFLVEERIKKMEVK